jgi:signal transduction histidine kinase
VNNQQNARSKGNILVVDDAVINLRLLSRALEEQGYDVQTATSGPRALETVEAEPPDLILLDIMMPEMDGYTVCEQLKGDARTRDIPVIFISALDETLDKVKAFTVGGVDYISRPFQAQEMLARVETHLTLREMQRRLQEQNRQLEQEIVERKRAEEALALARDQALEASRLKSQLLSNVSHDLRSPLGNILGHTEMLQAGVHGPLSDRQQEVTTRIIANAQQLLGFINNLLGQAQLEAGRVMLNVIPFAPAEILKTTQGTIDMLAQTRGLELICDVEPDIPDTLYGDPYWLRQILVNLVGNAIKFTEEGTVQMHIYRADQDHWAIQVSDTGCGIPAEAQSYIFDAFRQVDGTAIRKQQTGSGLGLSIVKQLTALMQGKVTLTSQVGKGSTFTVLLPLKPIQEKTT